jgi:hypothetical protein
VSVELSVVVDGERVLRYDRDHPLDARQRASLSAMDRRLDEGFELEGRRVEAPDPVARARFVSTTLLQALDRGDDAMAAASTAWLATRFPELQQLRVTRHPGRAPTIELIFDRPYAPEARVAFTPDPTKRA